MITRIDPKEFANASTVQLDSDAGNPWLAISEIEDWARQNGFVRTSEYQPRMVLIEGLRRYRCICYRISPEEREALEQSHQKMIDRGEALRGLAIHAETR
jgi:hypothetical protein